MGKPSKPYVSAERRARGRDAAIRTDALVTLFAGVAEPHSLLVAFADGVAGLHDELGDVGHYLQAACADSDWIAYGRAMRQLIDKYLRFVELESPVRPGTPEADRLRNLLQQSLGVAMTTLLRNDPALSEEALALSRAFCDRKPGADLDALSRRLAGLCHRIGLHTADADEQVTLLISLFELLLENVGELLDEKSWLHGEVTQIRALLTGPMDRRSIEETRARLREVIYRQALLREGIDQSKTAMKDMMGTFVERLNGMAVHIGEYQDRLSGHARKVREARNIAGLNSVLDAVLEDTGRIQTQALRARDELVSARREVKDSEARILELEQQLRNAAGLACQDELTGCLNRRGFDEAFDREVARSHEDRPLCLALVDLDDFRRLNAIHGHLGGDAALRHFVDVARLTLRDSDTIGRFGGEEFVILVPATTLTQAAASLTRLRTVLAHRPVVHDDARILITFSGGAAMHRPHESLQSLLKRADLAMYSAKRAGKDRSTVAPV